MIKFSNGKRAIEFMHWRNNDDKSINYKLKY